MNPYTPPAEQIEEAASVARPLRNDPPARPLRSFVVAVFGTLICAGPYVTLAPMRTLICAVTFGAVIVWLERLYRRGY